MRATEGLSTWDAATRPGCCATWWCARGAAPVSCRRGWSRARATSAPPELAAAIPADSVLWTRAAAVARDHARRRHEGAEGQRQARGGAERAALPHLPRRLLPDEHRDGRASLPRRRASWPALTGRSAYSTSSAGSARSGSRSPRMRVRSGASRSSRTPSPTRSRTPPERDRQRALLRGRHPDRDAPARRAGGAPDVVVVDPPRAGLSQKIVRRIAEMEADRAWSTSHATRRRSRRTRGSS